MSNLPIIETINTNIANLKNAKQNIKNTVNTDYDFINNEQIESYPDLIKQGIAYYKNRVPHATKEGTDLSFNAVPLKFENMTIKGNTEQASTSIASGDEYDSPSPEHPQPIHVVTGNNTVEVQGKNLFDNITTQEVVADNGNIFNNSAWNLSQPIAVFSNETYTFSRFDGNGQSLMVVWTTAICDKFRNVSVAGTSMKDNEFSAFSGRISSEEISIWFRFKKDPIDNLNDFKTFVENNNLLVYAVLDKPVPIPITDPVLISQLEAIYNHLALVKGTNHITVTASDLKPYMKLSYKSLENEVIV